MSADAERQRSRSRSRERDAPTGIPPQSTFSRPGNLPTGLPLPGGGMAAPISIPNLSALPAFATATVRYIICLMMECFLIHRIIRPEFIFLTICLRRISITQKKHAERSPGCAGKDKSGIVRGKYSTWDQ